MSGSLYRLSYSLLADLGVAPKYYGHEPYMLLLHQPAYILYLQSRF